MNRRARSLPDGEQVVIRLRPHGRTLVLPLVLLLAGLAVAGFVAAALPAGEWQGRGRWAVGAVTTLVVLRVAVLPWLRWRSTVLLVTDRRVTVQQGVLRRSSRGVPLSRVADVGVEQSLAQRLLRTGTLLLDTVGERGGLVVRDVPGVVGVAHLITGLLDGGAGDREGEGDDDPGGRGWDEQGWDEQGWDGR